MRGRSLKERKLGGRFVVGWGVLVAIAMAGTGLGISHLGQERMKPEATAPTVATSELEGKHLPAKPSAPLASTAPAIAQDRAASVQSTTIVGQQGLLRISNQTEQVIRVALLIKKTGKSGTGAEAQALYEPPAHWDFDPGEGSEKGLVVSLPKRNLKLKPGDILVAFAQDGSRQYWGPYVVGATSAPVWKPKAKEWDLVLSPQP
ncbi:hypothetical protein [Leptodesmis sichuanensis]|uniref:hypothetical protein n=1 Tax=Leptodesmis sichuanensis TaxID=2906798 RepID=UPI001F2BD477|nr:hypothetical protein [Leptodesmis sichuanensis]UIE39510.1 hypothetical protein KIK02_08110 [Leptodesmis sichuanensis A121]